MADVFISYKSEDRELTERLESALTAHQLQVWWDRELKPGHKFRREIEERLEAAGAVVVIWTERSVGSDFVVDEASDAKDAGKLVPVKFSDDVRLPFGFRQLQTLNLTGWDGDAQDPRIVDLVSQIDRARRGRIGAAASEVRSAVRDAIKRRASETHATFGLVKALQFLDFLGLPLYRLFAGVLVVASLVTAFWLVPAVIESDDSGAWPVIFALSVVAVLAARGMYQSAIVLSGGYSRQFFDGPFSFWTCFAAIAAVIVFSLFGTPLSGVTLMRILAGAPIYFCGMLFALMGLRLVGVAFGKLLART